MDAKIEVAKENETVMDESEQMTDETVVIPQEVCATVETESCYVVPFFLKEQDPPKWWKKSQIIPALEKWENRTFFAKKDYDTKYLATFTEEILAERENTLCKWSILTKEGLKEYKLPDEETEIVVKTNKSEFSMKLTGVELIRFSGGCGFLILRVCTKGLTLEKFTDFNALFCKFLANDCTLLYYTEQQQIDLQGSVLDILGGPNSEFAELFPSFKTYRCNVYHRVLQEPLHYKTEYESIVENKNKEQIYYMTRGLKSTGNTSPQQMNKSIYSSIQGTCWSVSPGGAAVLIGSKAKKGFLGKSFCANVMKDYFYAFLLALFERETLLYYNKQVVKNCDQLSKLAGMKNKLIQFDLCFSYNTISEEENYQEFYRHLYDAMDLDKLEVDVEEVITKVDEYTSNSKERRVNTLLGGIGVLAVFSALVDSFNFVDWWFDSATHFSFPYGLVLAVIVGVIGMSVWLLRRK